jgi:hypothetical protein
LGLQTLVHPWGQLIADRRHDITILVKKDSLAELKGAKHNSKIWNYLLKQKMKITLNSEKENVSASAMELDHG